MTEVALKTMGDLSDMPMAQFHDFQPAVMLVDDEVLHFFAADQWKSIPGCADTRAPSAVQVHSNNV